jgi:uncharacterized repeat protein (TIGR01451 family)
MNKVWVTALITFLMGLFGSTAEAAGAPDVVLAGYRVVALPAAANGKPAERLQPLGDVRPGDTVEYEAVYRNPTAAPARDVKLTLPVPAGGLQYLAATAAPAATSASLDGRTFEPLPITRTVTLPDGRTARREVPASEYRFLRWNLGDLPAGGTRTVRARMQLPAVAR